MCILLEKKVCSIISLPLSTIVRTYIQINIMDVWFFFYNICQWPVKAEYSKKLKEGEALRCKIGPTFYKKIMLDIE